MRKMNFKLFYALAASIFLLGLVQISLNILAQVPIIENAIMQGADCKSITNYLCPQVIPLLLGNIIITLGLGSILLGIASIIKDNLLNISLDPIHPALINEEPEPVFIDNDDNAADLLEEFVLVDESDENTEESIQEINDEKVVD